MLGNELVTIVDSWLVAMHLSRSQYSYCCVSRLKRQKDQTPVPSNGVSCLKERKQYQCSEKMVQTPIQAICWWFLLRFETWWWRYMLKVSILVIFLIAVVLISQNIQHSSRAGSRLAHKRLQRKLSVQLPVLYMFCEQIRLHSFRLTTFAEWIYLRLLLVFGFGLVGVVVFF